MSDFVASSQQEDVQTMDELDRLIGGCGTPLASFLLDSIEEGLYILDLDMRIRYWSPGAERITGRAPAHRGTVSRWAENMRGRPGIVPGSRTIRLPRSPP